MPAALSYIAAEDQSGVIKSLDDKVDFNLSGIILICGYGRFALISLVFTGLIGLDAVEIAL